MESTEDPFAAVEPDPLTGTTPEPPPDPADVLPEGVEPGQLGGVDVVHEDGPDAPPEPQAGENAGENGGTGPTESPTPEPGVTVEDEPISDGKTEGEAAADPAAEPDSDPIDDGKPEPRTVAPEEITGDLGEPETATPDAASGPPPEAAPASRKKKAAKAGGAPSRAYFIFEEIKIDLDGKETSAWVKRKFGNEWTITARNGPNALRAAGRAIGAGYEGTLVPVPVSMWNPQPVSTKQRDDLSVSVG